MILELLKQIPISWILGGVASFLAVILYKLNLHKAKKLGQDEIINKKISLDLEALLALKKKAEAIRAQTNKNKSCVPNDWDELDRLHRETGRTTLSQISGASVCTEMRSSSRSNKKNDAS